MTEVFIDSISWGGAAGGGKPSESALNVCKSLQVTYSPQDCYRYTRQQDRRRLGRRQESKAVEFGCMDAQQLFKAGKLTEAISALNVQLFERNPAISAAELSFLSFYVLPVTSIELRSS